MKKIIFIISITATLILLTFGLVAAAPPIQYDQIVIGGTTASDVAAVQAAVDLGGKILLRGTFNFGGSRVLIQNNNDGKVKEVEIYGETDNKGNPLTKVVGGFWTFYSPLPSPLPITFPGPKIIISGIHFQGSIWAPIYLAYTSGATITGNKITNIVSYNATIFYLNAGIICGPYFAQPQSSRIYREGAVTGLLKIDNNYIDLENSVPANTLGQGIFVNWTTGITANISDNIINNVSRNSIEVLDNYLANGIGTIVVEGNEIVTSQVGIPYPGPFTPNGIIFGWYLNPLGYDPTNNCLHTVMHNFIRIRGETSVGIMALADGSVVLNNNIVSEGTAARGLAIVGSHGYIAHNKIEGAGNYAIDVLPDPTISLLTASYNFFQGNNYNLFDAALFDLHFAKGADHNVFVGHSGNVSDEGDDNRINNFSLLGKTSTLGPKSFYLLTGQRRR